MNTSDHPHVPSLKSWVDSSNQPGCDFPIQNLPLGVQRGCNGDTRLATAIGDQIVDLPLCVEAGFIAADDARIAAALLAPSLNVLMAAGPDAWKRVRADLSTMLSSHNGRLRDNAALRSACMKPLADAVMVLPAHIGDYTDFYASESHATNVGRMFRPDQPLMPNWKHLPVGYHGRSSSIVLSGHPVRRPMGQVRPDDNAPPTWGPSKVLDYEMEMGAFIGPGNPLGERIGIDDAAHHVFGMVILNDWSARDVQKWEYQPLGPFCAKNFASSISPWVVTMDALAPFRVAGPPRKADDPTWLPYLTPTTDQGLLGSLDIQVEVLISSVTMREQGLAPFRVSRSSMAGLYWTIFQMVTHHTSTGCNLRPGDLLGTGTISGEADEARGCLLERTWRGQKPITLPDGSQRAFLADGDEVIMRAWCEKPGAVRIGFGECRGLIEPAA